MATKTSTEQTVTHTPGPWTVGPTQRKTEIGGFVMVFPPARGDDRQEPPIAYVADARDAGPIAAAPDMLTALKDVLTYWKATGFAECAIDCDCIVETVRAAIARAGQS